jgi:ATP-binding cassette subfamily F protein 3
MPAPHAKSGQGKKPQHDGKVNHGGKPNQGGQPKHGGKPQHGGQPNPGGKPSRGKRRFPFRKIADIEKEIAHRESYVQQLHDELQSEATYRDGGRVRQVKTLIANEKAAIKQLYEHWEEANELNW